VKKNFGPMIADQEKINECVQFAFLEQVENVNIKYYIKHLSP
jgi:hypothetical protein